MRSMTGCGSGSAQRGGWSVTAELKTVNHRFLDPGIRLPRNLIFLEQALRNGLGRRLKRGHADVYLTVQNTESGNSEVQTDPALAAAYVRAGREIAEAAGVPEDLTVSRIMSMEGVTRLSEREMDQETVLELCEEALDQALDQVVRMREEEGAHLREDLLSHLEAAETLRESILTRAPLVVTEYRARLETRIQQLLQEQPDPQRIAQETALMADRCAIDEELARLESHFAQMRRYLDAEGEIGKKMDFLIQEMNREANTIGSKASDGMITQWVVDLKSEIEKMREQIQNVE